MKTVLTEDLKLIMQNMAKRLALSDEQTSAAIRGLEKAPRVVGRFFKSGVLKKGLFCTPYVRLEHKYGGEVALAVTLALAECARTRYLEKGILDEVFLQTMSDIKIWADNYFITRGKHGVGELGWLLNHLDLRLFRLGRLQFQFFKVYNPTYFKPLGAKPGQQEIFVHIPQGEKLTSERAEASFLQATDFFRSIYPEYNYRYFITETWLLYSKNDQFMKKDSNILKFSALFEHGCDFGWEEQATQRIFGKEYSQSDTETSLQKSARHYKEAGGTFGVGLGYIKKERFKG